MAILNDLQKIDTHAFAAVFGRGGNSLWLRPLARLCSRSGDGYLQVLFPLALVWADVEDSWLFCQLFAGMMLVERALYFVLKNGLKRPRPQDAVPDFNALIRASDQFSFPSGHTSASFCLATASLLFFGVVALPLLLWCALVGVSRVLLGVHFPGDIVAGALLGSTVAASLLPFAIPV
jgi:undecaprenyl-diphosphatase